MKWPDNFAVFLSTIGKPGRRPAHKKLRSFRILTASMVGWCVFHFPNKTAIIAATTKNSGTIPEKYHPARNVESDVLIQT